MIMQNYISVILDFSCPDRRYVYIQHRFSNKKLATRFPNYYSRMHKTEQIFTSSFVKFNFSVTSVASNYLEFPVSVKTRSQTFIFFCVQHPIFRLAFFVLTKNYSTFFVILTTIRKMDIFEIDILRLFVKKELINLHKLELNKKFAPRIQLSLKMKTRKHRIY